MKEKQLSLNSLLPILSEFVHPTNTKTTNLETNNAVSRKSSPTHDEQSLPAMVPHCHHTKSNKPKMALPSTNTNKQTETEPISLELFNHAAADLNAKGEILLCRAVCGKELKISLSSFSCLGVIYCIYSVYCDTQLLIFSFSFLHIT